jgi:hypothetical protein
MNEDIIVKKIRYSNVKIFQFGNFDLKKGWREKDKEKSNILM